MNQIEKQAAITGNMTSERIKKAIETLKKYKDGKTNLEDRIIQNEQYWKLRHWGQMQNGKEPKPASGWLFNCVCSKHADAMDSYPEPNVLPREQGDTEEAKKLTEIIPVVLEQNGFEGTYSDCWWYKLKAGTGVYGVFWDKSKLGGLGDISIKKMDILNLFWEPGITDIQQSRNLFCVQLIDKEVLKQRYPQIGEMSLDSGLSVKQYNYEDNVDTSDKAVVVDWYYHTEQEGKKILQFCKFVGDTVLYSSEDDANLPNGIYNHARYPFVYDVMFPEEGSPAGFGYIDICKDPQKQIDLMNQAIVINTMQAAGRRFFIREDGQINEEEFADWTKPFVHYSGQMDETTIREINVNSLSGNYINILNNKIEELKETSGNRDVNNGGTTGGVTAASGIAAMQEQSGKLSRDMIKQSYRAYREIVILCIELIRQFYDIPRQFRIVGNAGEFKYETFSNNGIRPQPQENALGDQVGYRIPEFDLEINAQKETAYNKMSQNELALQFYGNGFFNPEMADQALACLDMMDFKNKDKIIQKIQQNGGMYQQMMMMQQQMAKMAQIIDATTGSSLATGMAEPAQTPPSQSTDATIYNQDSLGNVKPDESAQMEKARSAAQSAVSPR